MHVSPKSYDADLISFLGVSRRIAAAEPNSERLHGAFYEDSPGLN
jgi:hypothetical protein